MTALAECEAEVAAAEAALARYEPYTAMWFSARRVLRTARICLDLERERQAFDAALEAIHSCHSEEIA